MKYMRYMLIAVFAVMCLPGPELNAQSFVRWNATGWQNDNSTVREWQGGICVGYMADLSGQGHFFVKDNSVVMQIAVLPRRYRVTDFRIKDDSVFFCGRDTVNNYGIVGFFDINLLYAGLGAINYGVLNPQTTPLIPSSVYVTYPRRMDVYVLDGMTHIAFVGDMHTIRSGVPVTTTTVGSAVWDGLNWKICFYDNPSGDLLFTDVAASSSYVVAPANKVISTDYFVLVFNLSHTILGSPLSLGNYFLLTGNDPIGDILVEDISATDFVLAYHYEDVQGMLNTELQHFRVNPATHSVSVQNTMQTPHGVLAATYYPSLAMKQMCFDASVSRVLLLQDAATAMVPSVESCVFRYDLATMSSGVVDVSHIPGVMLEKIDAKALGGYYGIGEENGVLALAEEVTPPPPVTMCNIIYPLDDGIFTVENSAIMANGLQMVTFTMTALWMVPDEVDKTDELIIICSV